MTTLHEAAQQALEALERVCSHGTRTSQQIDADWDNARATIKALRSALAQQGEQPVASRFEAMHANGDVWITTLAAAAIARSTSVAPAAHPDARKVIEQMLDALEDACPVFLDKGKAHGAAIAAGQKLLKDLP